MKYKIPQFLTNVSLPSGQKNADNFGNITPGNTAEELLLMAAGAVPETPVVYVISGGVITGFLHPTTGATIPFPNGGINLASPGSIGATTPGVIKTSNLQATYTDSSGTPGNVTNNSPRGRAAFAAAGSSVTVTNSLVAATSSVHCQMIGSDATLTTILRCVPGAGSFVVTGNAAATATTVFDFLVIN